MLQMLKPFQEFGQQKLMMEVGSSDGKLEGDRSVVRSQPAALGVMIGQLHDGENQGGLCRGQRGWRARFAARQARSRTKT